MELMNAAFEADGMAMAVIATSDSSLSSSSLMTESGIKRFYVKDGYLTGFILVEETATAGIYTGLIRNRVPLSEIDFELMKKIPSNLIFSSKIRKKRFGKVV